MTAEKCGEPLTSSANDHQVRPHSQQGRLVLDRARRGQDLLFECRIIPPLVKIVNAPVAGPLDPDNVDYRETGRLDLGAQLVRVMEEGGREVRAVERIAVLTGREILCDNLSIWRVAEEL